jgi:hypothetical protein
MSWQPFVETQLIDTKAVTHGAILARIDGTVWAASLNFAVTCIFSDILN